MLLSLPRVQQQQQQLERPQVIIAPSRDGNGSVGRNRRLLVPKSSSRWKKLLKTHLGRLIKHAIIVLLLYTVLCHVSYTVQWASKQDMHRRTVLSNIPTIQYEMQQGHRSYLYSAFMLSKDRYDYRDNMLRFIDAMKRESVNGLQWRQFILFDIASTVPLQLHPDLQAQVEQLATEHRIDVKIVRQDVTTSMPRPSSSRAAVAAAAAAAASGIESNAEWTDEEKRTAWARNFRYSHYESMIFALRYIAKQTAHVPYHRIFYFDNCNFPHEEFLFENYLARDEHFYFPNEDRFFTANIGTDRDTMLRFLSDLPVHLLVDKKRSFLGSDQLQIWYTAARRALPHMKHSPHLVVANVFDDGTRWQLNSIITWRTWLYMNRYAAQPVHNNDYSKQDKSYCHDKRLLCGFRGALPWLLRQWGIWHMVDACLRLEFMWAMAPFIANHTPDWWIPAFAVCGVAIVLLFALVWRCVVLNGFALGLLLLNRLRLRRGYLASGSAQWAPMYDGEDDNDSSSQSMLDTWKTSAASGASSSPLSAVVLRLWSTWFWPLLLGKLPKTARRRGSAIGSSRSGNSDSNYRHLTDTALPISASPGGTPPSPTSPLMHDSNSLDHLLPTIRASKRQQD